MLQRVCVGKAAGIWSTGFGLYDQYLLDRLVGRQGEYERHAMVRGDRHGELEGS